VSAPPRPSFPALTRPSEVVEVPADSADARKWPRWVDPADAPANTSAPADGGVSEVAAPTPPITKKRPGPRKSKITLGAPAPPPPLSTLAASALDWRARAPAAGAAPPAKEQAGGGGFLARADFLARVGARKDAALDAAGTKRRR
jgi:hypothetical protein